MAQRNSGYEPIPNSLYQTPEWVVDDLLKVYRVVGPVLEPACGECQVVRALRRHGIACVGTDLIDYGSPLQKGQGDFTKMKSADGFATILVNPPYGEKHALSVAFIEHALRLMEPSRGQVVMLFPSDFDHAASRRHLFNDHPAFKHRIVLHRRIKWFDQPPGEKKMSPSTFHSWFVWDWTNKGAASVLYA